MNATVETRCYAVFDQVLPEDELCALQDYASREHLISVHAEASGYERVWSFDDGVPLQGPGVAAYTHDPLGEHPPLSVPGVAAQFPTHTALDFLLGRLLRDAERFTPWLGRVGEEWSAIGCRLWAYPPGTGLEWHNDATTMVGAFTYYLHPRWSIYWGGELLILDQEEPGAGCTMLGSSNALRSRMSPRNEQRTLGSFIIPAPNRLVILKGGTPHRINHVRPLAGMDVRLTIAGFFQPHPGAQRSQGEPPARRSESQ